jgi:multidrug efflux pump subunit AcrB
MERRVAQGPDDALGSMRLAAAEFLRPLAGSSAATVLIFLPLAFLTGVTGAFFKVLALTMAIALTASFLLAWLIVPIMVERLYRSGERGRRRESRFAGGYRRALEGATSHAWIAALVMIPLAAAGILSFTSLPSGFMPRLDEGGFILDYIAPPGASLGETDRLVRQIETILRATPEVATYSRRTGAQLGGDLTESNVGDFFVRLKPGPRRTIETVMDEVRARAAEQVPGLDIDTAQLMEDLIGDLTAAPQPIEVKLYSEDQALLQATAERVAKALGRVRGVAEVRDGVVVAGDALDVRVDLARAAIEGVTPADASGQIKALLSGDVATQIQSGPLPTDVRVWIPSSDRDRASRIAALPLRAADGHVFPLSHIASVDTVQGQPELTREGGRRMIAVTARVSGRDMGSTAKDVQRLMGGSSLLPAGVTFEMGGLFAEQQSAFAGLAGVFVAALAIVTVLLLLLYENFRIVATIIAMPLMAACFVSAGLWLAGVELNIMALMGLTMVVGIVTEVAIFYFTEYDALVADGVQPAEALIDAGANRLRPIAMTTLAAVLALTPLALGSSMQQPLAIAIIAGLIAQGPLVLLIMPALYRLIGGAAPPPGAETVPADAA